MQKNHDNKRDISSGKKYLSHVRQFWNSATGLVILLTVTVLVYTALLYCTNYLWFIYVSTDIGQKFVIEFPDIAKSTSDFLRMSFFNISLDITLISFLFCLVAGSVCQVFHVTRFIYVPHGLLGKVTYCGLPLTFLVALYIHPIYKFSHWSTAIIAAAVPTLFIFGGCFDCATRFLPELSDLLQKFRKNTRK
jgi:hypothetical protein